MKGMYNSAKAYATSAFGAARNTISDPRVQRMAKAGLNKYGGSMAVGAAGGYMASGDGFTSTATGMAGGAALGFAASKGAFGGGARSMAAGLNRGMRAPGKAGMRGYEGAKMKANQAYNSVKSTLGGK
jgi:hypothetical protein